MVKTITVSKIDIDLLRRQRDYMLSEIEYDVVGDIQPQMIDGIINLLDAMLDNAEGYGEEQEITERELKLANNDLIFIEDIMGHLDNEGYVEGSYAHTMLGDWKAELEHKTSKD